MIVMQTLHGITRLPWCGSTADDCLRLISQLFGGEKSLELGEMIHTIRQNTHTPTHTGATTNN